jgi:hypothetical protein
VLRSLLPAVLGIFGPTLLFVACGPSVQSIYEGNIRFEHCYRLDLDLNIAPTHRAACWKQWLSSFTYGQPRDRIEYARRRARAFANGDVSRPTLETTSKQRTEQRQFYLVVPGPTSVYAPPPPVAVRVVPETPAPLASASAPAAPPPTVPGKDCARDCEESFLDCRKKCSADGGLEESTCKSCEPDFKRCMKRCFQ